MKETGIVRRIDELGRVVIPKELRRTLKIREGDPIEIFTGGGGELILKKYSPLEDISEYLSNSARALSAALDLGCLVCDRDRFAAGAGAGVKEYIDKTVGNSLDRAISERKPAVLKLSLVNGGDEVTAAIAPIITGGDCYGAVICLISKGEGCKTELKASEAVAGCIALHFEE